MKGKGCFTNLTAVALFLSFALFIGVSIFSLPTETYAAVTALNAWTNIHNSAPGLNAETDKNVGSLTVSSGSNRLFLAAVCLETNAVLATATISMTLGGTALTTIGNTGTASVYEHCYMGYLDEESPIPPGSNSLSVTYDLSGAALVNGIHVKWASYSDVGRGNPINDSNANTNGAVTVTFGAQIDYIADGLTVYVAANGGGAGCIMTAPLPDFSQSQATSGSGHSSFIANTANHGSSGNYASGTTVSFSGTTQARSAIVVAAINPPFTIVGNNDGTGEPANVTIAPGTGATVLDAFTLKTVEGSDTVTAVTVALSSGSSGGLSRVQITSDDGGTVYGYVDDPGSDTVPITVTDMPTVTTAPTQYKVWITPKSHVNMPATPGSTYTVTGTVTGITCTYRKGYYDTASATITIDNDSPDVPTGFNGIPGDTQVILTWTNPGDADFSEVVILRNTSTFTDTPVEGMQYYQNDTIGTNGTVVRYVGSLQTFTDTVLTNEVSYYYKIFAKDSNGNYSTPGTASVPYPCIPRVVVTAYYSGSQIGTIDDGTNDQYIGAAFTFQQSSGIASNITALTISETGDVNADAVLSGVKVYYESGVSGSCVYDGSGETLITTTVFNTSDKIVLSSIIPVTLSPNFTCIYVVFDVGDSVDRNDPYVELEITSSDDITLSGSLIKAGTPVYLPGTTTLTDTNPPGNVTGQTATVGNTEITLNWTNPSGGQYDDDYAGVLIRRKNGVSAPTNCTTDGIVVVNQPEEYTSYTDEGLTNGQKYSYRLCSYDENPGRLFSTGVTITDVTPSNEPTLTYPASPYNDGKNPDTGDTTVNFTFKVIYNDIENNAPASGYPKIYIGDNDDDGYASYSASYTMSLDSSAAYSLRDGTYSNSEQYVYGPIGLGAAQDLRFYFEAQAIAGNLTVVKLPPTDYSPGPSVYLMNAANMVGVPKDLGDGLSYGSVLGDDSGVGYCVFWDSAGLDTETENLGDWSYCNSGIEKGKGYYIWAASADSYRLDEPDGVVNVADTYVDIALDPDGGWTMISNPYNVIIELQNVKVIRDGDPTEYTFDAAVKEPNEWIGNSIYEWEGYLTGYTFKAYNGSPLAKLEPWVGYYIYMKDTTDTTLRVYKPVP